MRDPCREMARVMQLQELLPLLLHSIRIRKILLQCSRLSILETIMKQQITEI